MIVLGAMASRAAQVTIIRNLGIKNHSPTALTFAFLRDGLVLLFLEILLLVIWQNVQSFEAVFHQTDELNLLGEWRCEFQGVVFPTLQGILSFAAIVYGIVQVRDIDFVIRLPIVIFVSSVFISLHHFPARFHS